MVSLKRGCIGRRMIVTRAVKLASPSTCSCRNVNLSVTRHCAVKVGDWSFFLARRPDCMVRTWDSGSGLQIVEESMARHKDQGVRQLMGFIDDQPLPTGRKVDAAQDSAMFRKKSSAKLQSAQAHGA
jgi:hypothetical protein